MGETMRNEARLLDRLGMTKEAAQTRYDAAQAMAPLNASKQEQ